eukprot:SAG22_NODE_1_length_62449_cov_158.689270_18_plen_95_part_00
MFKFFTGWSSGPVGAVDARYFFCYLIAPFKFGFEIGERGGAAAVRTYDIMKHDHSKGLAWGGKAVKQFGSQYKIADRQLKANKGGTSNSGAPLR